MKESIRPDPETWNSVGDDYRPEVEPFEAALAKEIHALLSGIGIGAGSSLLEAGSGSGHLSLELAGLGHDVTLLDFAPTAIGACRQSFARAQRTGRFVEGDLLRIPQLFDRRSYDVVWNSGVLEHFDDDSLRAALRAMGHAARRAVVFLVPNPDSFLYQLYRLQMLRAGRWNVGVEFLRRDYARIASSVGFARVDSLPCGVDFTEVFNAVALRDAEVMDAARTLLRADGFFADQFVLRCFVCAVDADVPPPRPQTESDAPGFAIDRTFYLDALGAANAATTAFRTLADRERAHAEAAQREVSRLVAETDRLREQLARGEAAEHERSRHEAALAARAIELEAQLAAAAGKLDRLAQDTAWARQAASRVQDARAAVEHSLSVLDTATRSILGRLYRFATIGARSTRKRGVRGFFGTLGAMARYAGGNAKAFASRTADDPLLMLTEPLDAAAQALRTIQPPVEPIGSDGAVAAAMPAPERDRLRRRTRSRRKRTGTRRVAYLTNQLLDWDDRRPRYGGGERYCMSLTALLTDLGFEVDLFQIGREQFTGTYHGHRVRAIPIGVTESEFWVGAADAFYDITADYDHVVYNLPELSAGRMRTDALTICHGIWFDHGFWPKAHGTRSARWYGLLRRAFSNPSRVVSVDSASINVVRSMWPDLSSRMHYIPNFVDPDVFHPGAREGSGKPVVLIPRRSHANRGSRLLARLLDRLRGDVDVYWVGEGDAPDTELIKDLCRRDPRLRFDTAEFDEMPGWYRRADIAVIPTVAAEGTSLSCLEAMASGCAVVSTHIGGLGNIVQDEVNGLLVDPTADSLAHAIDRLIDDRELRARLAVAGRSTAEAFSLQRWRRRWTDFLGELGWLPRDATPAPKPAAGEARPRVAIVSRNAGHGGVESIVRAEAIGLGASVLVAGGLRDAGNTCTFAYEHFSSYETLKERLADFDVVLYHWPVDWAVRAIRDSGVPGVEFVHRTDTADCDKAVPARIVTTSGDVVAHLAREIDRAAVKVPQVVQLDVFGPRADDAREAVGGITSYTTIKGVDVVLRAWALLPDSLRRRGLRFYGEGDQLPALRALADQLGIEVDFRGPVRRPQDHIGEFALCVSGARQEGLPVAVLEAFAAGVPVVHSDIYAAGEIAARAQEMGLRSPLLTFRSEDAEDLARVLRTALSGQVPTADEVRHFVSEAFASRLHVDAVSAELQAAIRQGATHPRTDWELIDDVIDEGAPYGTRDGCGFALDDLAMTQVRVPPTVVGENGALLWSAEAPLRYRYDVPAGAQRVSIEIAGSSDRTASMHVQVVLRRADGVEAWRADAGRYVDGATPSLYWTRDVDESDREGALELTVTPCAGARLQSTSVRVGAWVKRPR